MHRFCFTLLFALAALTSAASDTHPTGIGILPAEFTLSGSEARQRLSVVAKQDDRIAAAILTGVELTSSDPQIVTIQGGIAVAVADGSALITATVGDQTATAKVTVTGTADKHTWSFRNDVQSVFSRIGCNTGACHGALAGKGGFRLSLRGYDPDADYFCLTREARATG